MTTLPLYHQSLPTVTDEKNNVINCTSISATNTWSINGSAVITFQKKLILIPVLLILFLLKYDVTLLFRLNSPRRDWNFWKIITNATTASHNGYVTGGNRTEKNYAQQPLLRPLVISGPSGVGKGTLIDMLVKYYNQQDVMDNNGTTGGKMATDLDVHYPLGFSVSHTTRNPRPGEINGIHYHFTTREEMLKAIENNEFIEYAHVHGNIYGTSYESVQSVMDQGKICILDIDIQGAMNIMNMKKEKKEDNNSAMTIAPYFLFIAPPSMKALETRLRERGTETEDAIRIRLENAKKEVDFGLQPGNFDEVIVNDDLNDSFLHLRMILEKWYPHLNQVSSPSYDL
mmetsp:Transcript_9948/g.18680  ORF Transcript_9948/g.18680 Transcript_9948/m.18680 type:complete len:343 (-) Transcript_9948:67-1095(-)|eukprot:CAMPEP_0176493616 /NCGR_PEP_ID=MMETSP0200_2-20121128/9641_1 /TAXON_ID=947934 /ORGANISM="Chaetoceros sp., Strain GSL56" /LENGTH=342 /DNA_ID=CAMNT_0017891285 /DNA_START=184 /DNA_END=1212 /DNA_ORIENTATION=+